MGVSDIMIGDLVIVWTGGWDKIMRSKYENRVGVVVSITKERDSYVFCGVNFGEGTVQIPESRLRLLPQEKK